MRDADDRRTEITPASYGTPAAGDAACANCGAPLVGPYCAHCGQRAGDRLLSVRHIVSDALEDQLSLTAALPRTVAALLLHPGLLTEEYLRGRIARYIPPMRLYLVCSLLFFLTLSFVAGPPKLVPERGAGGTRADSAEILRVGGGHLSLETKGGPAWLTRRIEAQRRRLEAMGSDAAGKAVFSAFLGAAPKVVFIVMPLSALLLKAAYRRRRLYVEHFIFALHIHALVFAAFTLIILLRNGWVNLAIAAWVAVYLWLAMRRVYREGWFRTTVKYVLLGYSYLLILAVGVGIGMMIAVLAI